MNKNSTDERQIYLKRRERLVEIYRQAYAQSDPHPVSIANVLRKINLSLRKIDTAKKSNQLTEAHEKVYRYYQAAQIIPDKKNRKAAQREAENLIRRLAVKDFGFVKNEEEIDEFLSVIGRHPSKLRRSFDIQELYYNFQEEKLKDEILDRVQSDPVIEFEKARAMTRRFHLHIGPTNSGKTYDSIQQLKKAECGVYLSPLRLLALEIYDTMTEANVLCSMLTGEEHIDIPESTVISQTIETVDLSIHYDIAVIDECQMLTDESRGYAWSKAILGLLADDIYLCASEDAKEILIRIIEKCGDVYDVTHHERKTKLRVEEDYLDMEQPNLRSAIQEGDCFILFSKRAVLDMAARLEMTGLKVSVIYGKLPPETRKREVYKFANHETQVVVATDAIGMGINLPIRRIIFAATQKFDGRGTRELNGSEVRQIGGRAGRFGRYDEGLVTATSPEGLMLVRECMQEYVHPIKTAILYFPRILLEIDKPVKEIIGVWASIPAVEPYKKMNVFEMQYLYDVLEHETSGFKTLPEPDNKYVLYDMISCPLDIKNRTVVRQWARYCQEYTADVCLRFPSRKNCYGGRGELDELEDYYKLLDLYHIFSLRLGKIMDEDRLREEKNKTENRIEYILSRNKKRFAKRCTYCGKVLPLESEYKMCPKCYAEQQEYRRIYKY